jgi:hypothetical protein
MNNHFVYVVDSYRYILRPVFKLTRGKFLRINGAEMYGAKNSKYYGYWSRENIPLEIIRQLESYSRYFYARGMYETDNHGLMRVSFDKKIMPE